MTDDLPIGHPDNPEFQAVRDAIRETLPLFAPPGASPSAPWGAGLVNIDPMPDGSHRVWILHPVASRWTTNRNSVETLTDVEMIRATGIALLAYAEAHS